MEHNLPFAVMDHLSDLVKDILPDSNIASKFKSKHTKTRSIIKNVLAKRFWCDLIETLRNIKFSIIIDESTNISLKKQLAVVVRFFCHKEHKVRSQFLCLIDVTQSDATTLTDALTSYFEKNGIPLQNIIGFASDTTNVMFGKTPFSCKSLESKNSTLIHHSAHLCASHACEKLPQAIEDLVRDIYIHIFPIPQNE